MKLINILTLFIVAAAAAPFPPQRVVPVSNYYKLPFDKIVAFGDELSDNGNGSYAHGITGSPADVYGFGTWTNGPVAVSYLSNKLSLGSGGLQNYAFGGANGGADFGATLDNAYTPSKAGAASLVDQIHNYTQSDRAVLTANRTLLTNGTVSTNHTLSTDRTLAVIWAGQNDLSAHTNAWWLQDPHNAQFAADFSTKVTESVQTLLHAGVPYVLVANIYPKHIAPVTAKYLCGASDNDCVTTWGQVISDANAALKTSLRQFGRKVIYYDSFSYISNIAKASNANGFTRPLTSICDGQGDANWQDCMVDGNVGKYFWMNFVQPTTRVHEMIAEDMRAEIRKHFGAG